MPFPRFSRPRRPELPAAAAGADGGLWLPIVTGGAMLLAAVGALATRPERAHPWAFGDALLWSVRPGRAAAWPAGALVIRRSTSASFTASPGGGQRPLHARIRPVPETGDISQEVTQPTIAALGA